MLKRLLGTICCLMGLAAQAQETKLDFYRSELSFTNENDAYLFQKKDANYSNGFFVKFMKAGEKRGNKITRSYELGQMIYTPLIRKTTKLTDIDRPYCGYLFFKYGQTGFYRKEQLFQYTASFGIVGPASFGEEVQNGYHKLLNFATFEGWQYQVQNSTGIDIGFTYAKTVLHPASWIKWVPTAQLNLGTFFTNAKLGSYFCAGRFEINSSSALWNARIQPKAVKQKRNYELFVYWFPQIILQAYNATVEGGMINKKMGTQLGETTPFMFQEDLGICYAQDRWTTKIVWIYQSREAVAQKNPQQYVSLQVGYRMH
jgi:lipid A 3-O-deacylase